jgi:hypothetical protein
MRDNLQRHCRRDHRRVGNHEALCATYEDEMKAPSVASMVWYLLCDEKPPWSLSDHNEVHAAYFRNRYHINGLRIPRTLEAGVTLDLAERHRIAGDCDRVQSLLAHAVENNPGHAVLRDLETNFDHERPIKWSDVLLPVSSSSSKGEATRPEPSLDSTPALAK